MYGARTVCAVVRNLWNNKCELSSLILFFIPADCLPFFDFLQIMDHGAKYPNVRDDPMPSDIDDLLGPDDDNPTSSDHGKGQMKEKLGRSGASASAGAASHRIPTGGAFQSGSTP